MIDNKQIKQIQKALEKLKGAGFEAAIVGGAVRDLLSSREVVDWDLTTKAKPEEILKLFDKAFYNNQFGTVGVPNAENVLEITTYRKESGYSDSRHPDEISWGKSLEEDLS